MQVVGHRGGRISCAEVIPSVNAAAEAAHTASNPWGWSVRPTSRPDPIPLLAKPRGQIVVVPGQTTDCGDGSLIANSADASLTRPWRCA